ncbi:MAG: lipid kinase YegS [Myxococcales bacterium]|nr:lipid kinase YegS [Myxococcales bacterium]MCB9708945.1 lipid kinase YegS [Myxococcales bacterium]
MRYKPQIARARIIAHGPKASNDVQLRAAVEHAREQGFELDVRTTWEEGDEHALVAEASGLGISQLIAAGGDGTLHHVSAGIMALPDGTPKPSLGVLRMGTANDFAKSAGIVLDIKDELMAALTSSAVMVDVPLLNGRPWINMATGGFGAQVTTETPDNLKSALGKAAYVLTGLFKAFNLETQHVRITGPDMDWKGEVYALVVGNGRQAGGGIELCPEAYINDGLLDIVVLPSDGTTTWSELLESYVASGWAGLSAHTLSRRLPHVTLSTDAALAFNLDGEPIEASTFEFTVQPQALAMHLPKDCPLLTQQT